MKSGLKAAVLLQYSQELQEELQLLNKTMNDLTNLVRKGFETQKRKLLLKDSIRVLNWYMKRGHSADDFTQNMYSVVFTGKGYKVPRIVKRLFK
jgi:hypothetical protein